MKEYTVEYCYTEYDSMVVRADSEEDAQEQVEMLFPDVEDFRILDITEEEE